MKTTDFDFTLPEASIAEQPISPRDTAKMLVIRDGKWENHHVRDLVDFLQEGDVLVVNNTKVIPARLFGMRGEAKIELLLHKQEALNTWTSFAKPAKKLKPGDTIVFAEDFTATVQEKSEGQVLLTFECGNLYAQLECYGLPPLPPYIKRKATEEDVQTYQTVYAKHKGAVAAPTAGLHFTPELLESIQAKGVSIEQVTLHVGAGTFQPVKVDDISEHVMHSEYGVITKETAERINTARKAGGRIVAVGTTSLRLLESAVDKEGKIHSFCDETDIFITPPYNFKAVDILLTNFHLPKSTLFMLVCAFAGMDTMKEAYAYAIAEQYRFYSYGDACLLFPK